jgi:nitrogenase molybdenum-iron protein NifN
MIVAGAELPTKKKEGFKPGFENPCKLCSPLGASLCLKGIEGAMTILHGSQGCSTYIRRYLIGHFREPVDIASSNFHEETAIFGGQDNLHQALLNVESQYKPSVLGIATTCLAETVGENMPLILNAFEKVKPKNFPPLVWVSTPSYQGTHREGFHRTVLEVVKQTNPVNAEAEEGKKAKATTKKGRTKLAVFPGMVSPADIRWLKRFLAEWKIDPVLLPDYSSTLDGGLWERYHHIPPGGTPIKEIRNLHKADHAFELGRVLMQEETGGKWLEANHGVPLTRLGYPLGLLETDLFVENLEKITGRNLSEYHNEERERLLDALVDAHKYTAGYRAMIYGDEDLVVAMASFLQETGIKPAMVVTGGRTGKLRAAMEHLFSTAELAEIAIYEDKDFMSMEDLARDSGVNLMVGNSKGYKLAKKLQVPLFRVGFPIHDRFGAGRILHFGYEGAQRLLDSLINMLLEKKQADNPVGYTYQ